MPRLPAALAVLLTMSVCIGFNTIRYPAVWRMVGQPDPWPPPASPASGAAQGQDSPAPPASGSQAVFTPRACEALRVEPSLSGPIPTTSVATPPKTRVVCNGSMCSLVKEPPPEPAAAPVVAKSSSPVRDAVGASDAPEATVAGPLVPIVRPPKPAAAAPVLASAFETADVDHDPRAQDKVRPLPPADRVLPVEPASPQDELPADQIPLYPTTRTRPAG
jgi:hypothetical protein